MLTRDNNLAGVLFALLTLILAFVFSQQIYDGDSYQFAGLALDGDPNIDSNHLLMGPVALAIAKLLPWFGNGSIFDAFKMLSALAAAVSMFAYVRLLHICGIRSRWQISVASFGVLSSFYFVYAILCEEFYVIQLPFLMFGMQYAYRALTSEQSRDAGLAAGYAAILFSIAALINLHNVVLCLVIGLLLWRFSASSNRFFTAFVYCITGVVVGSSGWLWGYAASATDAGFIDWVTSYQGSSDSTVGEMYGMSWSVSGVIATSARLVVSMIESIAYLGSFPAQAKALIGGRELQFVPSFLHLVAGITAFCLSCVLWLGLIRRLFRHRQSTAVLQLCLAWILAYLLFGFYWSQKVAQFWFAIVPAFWLLLVYEPEPRVSNSGRESRDAETGADDGNATRWRRFVTSSVVGLILINYTTAIYPGAAADLRGIEREYLATVGRTSLVISPGWGAPWINYTHQIEGIEALYLMEMALDRSGHVSMHELPGIVETKLRSGQRVFINRLFDKDPNPKPWSDLENLSWPRDKVIALLDGFCVGDQQHMELISLRELSLCTSSGGSLERR